MSRVPTMRAFLAFFDESMTPTKDGLQSSTEEIFPTVSSANLAAYPL
ncbi:MAG: hypothetical protein ACRD4F_09280 [Candidatus Angelobacter sp.]